MINEQGFIVAKKSRVVDKLAASIRQALRPVEFMSDEELTAMPAGSVFVFDVETYVNFFYVAFKSLDNGKFVAFERSPDHDFNPTKLLWMLWRFCIVGFNSRNYDLPMIELAARGADCKKLKEASDFIIKSGPNYGTEKVTPFAFEKKYGVQIGRYNHIDLIEVAPLQGSLKLYAGRLHCERMQDLPFPEDHVLTQEDAEIVRPYCCNDLSNTELLFNELAPELKLRAEMSEEYGVDLRSKSDAQVAEAVINSELQKVLGYYPKKPTLSADTVLVYDVPDFVCYQTTQLREMLEVVRNARFYLDGLGSPIMPPELEKLKVTIGGSTYKLGMGGLHSTEKKTAHYATDEIILADNDVESFYPRTILNQRLCPPHLGEAFLTVYEKIVNTRIHAKAEAAKAKKAGDRAAAKKWKTVADSLKITINGSFGKLGNKYSTLYAPQLMLQVTITGQLVLLMLIEALEQIGIEVISGNTDGIISKYHKSRHDEVRALIAAWEEWTGYKTEETRYKAVFSRDVNSYVAIKEDGGDPEARFLDEQLGAKTKGAYCERGSALNSILSKNPETLICSDAVVRFLVDGTPVEKTIKECRDFRRFVAVKNVRGGGEKNGRYLGKVVRWYYPKNEAGYIAYVSSGNKVGKTDGARPVMDLPTEFPDDINYDWYINEAVEMLYDCGRLKKAKTAALSFF
ncbi:DNA polymerase [Stenotrophomonas phage vB_SmaS-DLP_2]|uniref:DNA polymerase n=2 Tax=Septimatrevirus TaxID=1921544 RepID=A0A0M3MX78_9CAUD|nr:DNA polymerase [Stenotrophomonas phage vB_SmaS-DLP_2]YP_010597851.1 DNA polymerase [Pseudomonas phage BUCT-PX-5]AKI28732.1 DNA polymerase [Stenotrophomonas phage vB_SmaS-DLP_2]UYE91319.1 DNA polymerase [Pseudomonas phage BUCT-PX-5]